MLQLEVLESRDVPSTVTQQGSIITVYGDVTTPNVITADTVGTQTRIAVNGSATFYNNLTQLILVGGSDVDYITNNTSVNSSVYGLDGDDVIQASGGNDLIVPGQGRDIVYDLLGTNFIYTNEDKAKDTVFTNFQSNAFVGDNDQLVTFFAPNRTPGSGFVGFENGVIYITPSNNGTSTVIDQVGGNIVVTYDMNDGNGIQNFSVAKNSVDFISYFGGSGNDTYINNTDISEAAYGSAGNDVVIGGFGKYNLLKGSGGNDILMSRGKVADMSGNGGSDIFISDSKQATFRTDALDYVFGYQYGDLVIMS